MGMDWKRYLSPPWRERAGNRLFTGLVLSGAVLMVLALGGVYFEGLRERLGGFFTGAGMAAGGAGTLATASGRRKPALPGRLPRGWDFSPWPRALS